MNRSIEFYTNLLGLELIDRKEIPQNNAEIAFLRDPKEEGSILELTLYRDQKKFLQAEYKKRLFDHLAFKVKNMEKTIKLMKRAKITITDEPFEFGSKRTIIAFIEDPDGILIELIEKNN
jgi:lactoylglutathione lyase